MHYQVIFTIQCYTLMYYKSNQQNPTAVKILDGPQDVVALHFLVSFLGLCMFHLEVSLKEKGSALGKKQQMIDIS